MEILELSRQNEGVDYFFKEIYPLVYNDEKAANKIFIYGQGYLSEKYKRTGAVEIILVLEGCIRIGQTVLNHNDMVIWYPGDEISFLCLTMAKLLRVIVPELENDIITSDYSYDEIDAAYNTVLNRLFLTKKKTFQVRGGKNIDPSLVTVVVQGYVNKKETGCTIKSVRKYLPGAKIILSTWKNCDVSEIDYDELVLNDDPGAVECGAFPELSIMNNTNRQIVSTQNGLASCNTPYTLKLRSDLILLGKDIVSYFDMLPPPEKYRIFKHRLLIGEIYTRHKFWYSCCGTEYVVEKPFHPSDWFVFGLTDDVRKLYSNISLIRQSDMYNYHYKYPDRAMGYKYTWRYTSEQEIFLGVVKQSFPDLKFDDWTDYNEELCLFSKRVIFDNFLILNFFQNKILNLKYPITCFANSGFSYSDKDLMTNEEQMNYCMTK